MTGLALMTRAPDRDRVARLRRRIGAAVVAAERARRDRAGSRGPEAVAASLVRGLTALGVAVSVNPRELEAFETVGVLSDLGALQAAIDWRSRSSRRRLIAGPNLVVLPSDAPELMSAAQIDLVVVPSEWVLELYERDMPALRGRVAVWPAGVDTSHWRPPGTPAPPRRRALIYRKPINDQADALDAAVDGAERALRDAGFATERLTYGEFGPRRYLQALHEADVLVFFSPTESQCLAVVEAWAAGIPTLVWARGRMVYRDMVYDTSSAPYLSGQTGRAFRTVAELAALLADWDALAPSFAPRRWVLEHMTDEICAARYRELALDAMRVPGS